MSPFGEADTRAKLIDPALHARGWTEDLIRREETAGAVEILGERARRRPRGRVDYALRIKVNAESQAVAVALLEAKAEHLPPAHGLEQAKAYAVCRRLNVLLAFASNGHQFVEYDCKTGLTTAPNPLSEFPTPTELRARYERAMGFSLESAAARPLLARYHGGEATRRYYQDAAIRAVLEKLARGEKRALLALATGSGKTFIAVHLLKKIADAGQMRRALFVCDRDELRAQGLGAFQNVFGADAAPVSGGNPQKNARILIATYQTLDVASEDADANFLTTHYPENYFSHIVIDECHRSAWGKWSQVLTRNPDAIQIGLTATPRQIEITDRSAEAQADVQISADNIRHFGEPVYEYDIAQGIEDGYLAACEIVRRDICEKLMFRVYDYTDATRLFGEEFKSKFRPPRVRPTGEPLEPPEPPERTLQVEGFEGRVTDAGRYIVISEDGRAVPVTIEEYKERLAARLVEAATTLDEFRRQWIVPPARRDLLARLPEGGRSALLIRSLEGMAAYDLCDVLGELGYGLAPRTRPDRADAFTYKHSSWLGGLPVKTAATLKALAGQFARAGTESLENPQVFQMPDVLRAGGLDALKVLGEPGEILHETKARLFAA